MDRKIVDTPELFASISELVGGGTSIYVGTGRTKVGFEKAETYIVHEDDMSSPLEAIFGDFGKEVAFRIARAAIVSCVTYPDHDFPAGN